MKKPIILWMGLGCGCFLVMLWALYYHQTYQDSYSNIKEERNILLKRVKKLEQERNFIKAHQQDLSFLKSKGWFSPQKRLLAIDNIEKFNHSLNNIRYRIEPEALKKRGTKEPFKVTQITFEGAASLDTDVYVLLEELFKKFEGVLKVRELILTRDEPMNSKNLIALKQGKKPNFVSGRLVVEWISKGGDYEE
jgi:hypothetical protein